MKITNLIPAVVVAAFITAAANPTSAADEPLPVMPASENTSPEVQKIRDLIKKLTPEQRQELFRSLRPEMGGPRAATGFRDGREATQAGAAARLQATPGLAGLNFEALAALPPEQQEARVKQGQERLQGRLNELQKRKEAGELTPPEERQLQNLQAVEKRLEDFLKASPEERNAKLLEWRQQPGLGRPNGPRLRPDPAAEAPARPRPFPPAEGDPNGLPPKPDAPKDSAPK